MFGEEAVLLVITRGKTAAGFPTEIVERIPVFVRERSVTRLEFYEAFRAGLKVSIAFDMRIEDWDKRATRIEYDGSIYDVVRTFRNDKSMISVICA